MEHAGRRAACGGVVGVRAVRWLGSGQRAGGAGQGYRRVPPCLDPITARSFAAGRRGQRSPASQPRTDGTVGGPIISVIGTL